MDRSQVQDRALERVAGRVPAAPEGLGKAGGAGLELDEIPAVLARSLDRDVGEVARRPFGLVGVTPGADRRPVGLAARDRGLDTSPPVHGNESSGGGFLAADEAEDLVE